MATWRNFAVLCGCCMVTLALGSIHAFSVLIGPIETRHQVARGSISLVYSGGLVCLTAAVLARRLPLDREPSA